MEEEIAYGLDNPSCCLDRASLPRSGALLPGMLVFCPLTKSLAESPISPPLGGWQGPKRWAAAHKAFQLFALCSLTPKCWWGKISNIFICFHLSRGFAGQAKFFPTLLVENRALLKSPPSGGLFHRVD